MAVRYCDRTECCLPVSLVGVVVTDVSWQPSSDCEQLCREDSISTLLEPQIILPNPHLLLQLLSKCLPCIVQDPSSEDRQRLAGELSLP